jgi:hypothetical protein
MLGNTHPLTSYATINGSGATFIVSTDTIHLRNANMDKLGLYARMHSFTLPCASPSLNIWYESSLYSDGPFAIPGGTNSITITNSVTQVFNLSANYMPYVRLCAVTLSATPTAYTTIGLFYQDWFQS